MSSQPLTGCPVLHKQAPEYWELTRHADITEALRNPALWTVAYGPGPLHLPPEQRYPLVGVDPPEHTLERRLVSKAFLPSAVAAMAPRIEDLVSRTLDAMEAGGPAADLVEDLAIPVPLVVYCWLTGAPEEEIRRMRVLAQCIAELIWHTDMASERLGVLLSALGEAGAQITGIVTERRAQLAAGEELPDDMITNLMFAEIDGERLDDQQIIFIAAPLLSGATNSTTWMLSNVVYRLLDDREQWELLCQRPELVEAAIEESLRFDPPVKGFFRTNTRPVELHGVHLEENSKVFPALPAANRDPAVWKDPDRFDITRDLGTLRTHYGFGHGVHFCLGAPLARLEGQIALRQLVERFPGLRLAGEPVPTPLEVGIGFDKLPVAWD